MHLYLNILANIVIEQYFSSSSCIFIFSDNNDFEYKHKIPVVNILMINSTFEENVVFKYYGCQGFIMNTATPVTSLEYIEQEIRVSVERFNYRKYLFLPTEEKEEDVMDVFNSGALEYIADLLVISPSNGFNEEKYIWGGGNASIEFGLYTHKFIGINDTDAILLLDKWHSRSSRFENNADLYPEKLKNGHGREFTVATFGYKPYSVPEALDGTELQLYLEFCKRRNLTTSMVLDQAGEWGEIYDNWTGYGILGNILNDNGDVGLAALYTWAHEYLFLDLSKPVVRTGITCLAPAPQLAGGWLVPLFPFTYEMWIAVVLSFLTCTGVFYLVDIYQMKAKFVKPLRIKKNLEKVDILEESFLNTSAIFLLQSISDENMVKDRVKKYIFACMFIFSLLIASTYSSGLASSMTVPRYVGAIKTVQDLVDSGIQWGATSIAWIMSIMDASEYNYRVLVERFVKTDGETLRTHNNKRFAFSVERLPAGYFAIGDYVTEEGVSHLRLMTEDIYWEQCVFMTKKSSIWLPLIDDFILVIAQTGIPSLWEYKVATTHLNAHIQRAVKYSIHHEDSDGPIKLKWEHVQGTFALWILGIISAFIRFIIELVADKLNKQKLQMFQEIHAD